MTASKQAVERARRTGSTRSAGAGTVPTLLIAAIVAAVVSYSIVRLIAVAPPGAEGTLDSVVANGTGFVAATAEQADDHNLTGEVTLETTAAMALLRDTVTELQRQLASEQTARLELQRELAEMAQSVDQLVAASLVTDPAEGSTAPISGLAESGSAEASVAGQESRLTSAPPGGTARDGLRAAGLDDVQAEQLLARLDEQQLQELELRDRAEREGWFGDPRYRDELQTLRQLAPDIRAELGDQQYDQYLFASGRPNRVFIANVIRGSAADIAGVAVGDIIVGYAGERVYEARTLQQLTRSGTRGEPVLLELQRNDALLDFSVARGPLGVSLDVRRTAPDL